MKNTAILLFIMLILFGCDNNELISKDVNEFKITAVDGYIKNAVVTDITGQIGEYSSNGLYVFENSISYPVTLRGGELEDTNQSFDIEMTSSIGGVISPITTFLGENENLLEKLQSLGLQQTTLRHFATDYIKTNDLNLAKLSQILFVILRDVNLTRSIKNKHNYGNNLNDMFDMVSEVIDSSDHDQKIDLRLLLKMVSDYNGSSKNMEKYITRYKLPLDLNYTPTTQSDTIPRFQVINDEIVKDNEHNLMWQLRDDNNEYKHLDANNYCLNLELGDINNWRLPYQRELISLTVKTLFDPSINPIFRNTKSGNYWIYRQLSYLVIDSRRIAIDFYDGKEIELSEDMLDNLSDSSDSNTTIIEGDKAFVRCVSKIEND